MINAHIELLLEVDSCLLQDDGAESECAEQSRHYVQETLADDQQDNAAFLESHHANDSDLEILGLDADHEQRVNDEHRNDHKQRLDQVENECDDENSHLESLNPVEDARRHLDRIVAKEGFERLQLSGDSFSHLSELILVVRLARCRQSVLNLSSVLIAETLCLSHPGHKMLVVLERTKWQVKAEVLHEVIILHEELIRPV